MNLYSKEEQRGKGSEGRWWERGKLTEQVPQPWEGDKQNRCPFCIIAEGKESRRLFCETSASLSSSARRSGQVSKT